MTPKFHTLTIKEVRKETEDTVSISFEIPSDLLLDYQYTPGQYLTLRTEINGEDIRRSYSLCSAPHENEWRVAVKKVDHGVFSTFANEKLKAGDQLEVMTPMGKFTKEMHPESESSYAFFAAGSGITPVLSLTKSILASENKSVVNLFYGNKNFQSIIFREEIEALKNMYMERLRVVHVLSRESLGNKIQKGRIDEEKTMEFYKAFLHHEELSDAFICGPEDMIFGVKKSLESFGMDPHNIHFELFATGLSTKKTVEKTTNEPAVAANVKIIIDGDELDLALNSTGINILDAAQNAGADLPFACKGGVCCTCKAKVLEGSVRMDVNYALEPEEVEAGFILTCQSHPTSEKLIVSFDE